MVGANLGIWWSIFKVSKIEIINLLNNYFLIFIYSKRVMASNVGIHKISLAKFDNQFVFLYRLKFQGNSKRAKTP